jgi:hypothetical protein
MTSRIAASVNRALRRVIPAAVHDDVHFHLDSVGRPYVCDYARCDSPGLTTDEAVLINR